MQNINPKLLEDLKQKNININLNYSAEKPSSQQKALEKQLQMEPNSFDPLSPLGATSSKFRVRPINSQNQEETLMRSTFNKTTGKFSARPTTASRNEAGTKNIPSQSSLPLSRPMTALSGNSTNSMRGPLVKSDSTRLSEDDGDNGINFVNMDEGNELAERFREELEIFNDIAGLDPEKLAGILNVEIESLEKLSRVELKVDLSFNSLQQAGQILKNLKQLKLNNSIINSLRDIGNSFPNLEILWVSKCGMKDLAGLSSFPRLQELYASYNNIKDLSDIIFHANLQVLDLEGNEIQDLETLQNLSSLNQLTNLTIASNPLCTMKNYQQKVLDILPQILYLNDESKEEIHCHPISNKKVADSKIEYINDREIKELYSKVQKLDLFAVEDFGANVRQAVLREMANEPSEEDIITMSVKKSSKKAQANLQENDELGKFSMKASTKKMTQRPQTSKARFGPKSSSLFGDGGNTQGLNNQFSDLVRQTDQAFAGNPLKALRHRRKNQFTAGTENIQGDNLAKPKDILKLIEEFELTDNSDSDEDKKYEELFSYKKSKSNASSQNEVPSESHKKTQDEAEEEQGKFRQTRDSSKQYYLLQRQLGPVARKQKSLTLAEKQDEIDTNSQIESKEISRQDQPDVFSNKPRIRVQIKTKRNATPSAINK